MVKSLEGGVTRCNRTMVCPRDGRGDIHGPRADCVVLCLPTVFVSIETVGIGRHVVSEVVTQPRKHNREPTGMAVKITSLTEGVCAVDEAVDFFSVSARLGKKLGGWRVNKSRSYTCDGQLQVLQRAGSDVTRLRALSELHRVSGSIPESGTEPSTDSGSDATAGSGLGV